MCYTAAEDSWFRKALLSAIALTRQQEAMDWLLGLVERVHARQPTRGMRSASLRHLSRRWRGLSSPGGLIAGDAHARRVSP